MLAAARKHKRVVQVGTQRKSTPHLIEAKKNRPGRVARKIATSRSAATTTCGPTAIRR